MSYVTTFDVPHIFRFGMTDDDKWETWQMFYRCATVFSVDIRREDIEGTPFEREWSKYVPSDLENWKKRWEDLCDVTVKQILPKLQELAPADGREWKTFQDYLEPRMYRLQLFKDEATGDAVAELMYGPSRLQCSLPYSLMPQPLSKLSTPVDLPHIQASEISIVDHHKDWRQSPNKARIARTGEVANLITAESQTQAVETGVVRNMSLEAIESMLNLHQVKENINIPKPLAFVTVESAYSSEVEMAGLLYLGVPEDAKRLADGTVDELKEAHNQGLTAFWKDQIKHILDILSSYDITYGSVHQSNIWIDSGTSAWLGSPRSAGDKPFEEGDLERLDYVFDFWLERKVNDK